MLPDQFALSALNGVALAHPPLEKLGLLLLAPGLQDAVMFADPHASLPLILAQTGRAQLARSAGRGVPFEAELDPALLAFQPTALIVGPAGRTHGPPLLHLDPERFHRETLRVRLGADCTGPINS